MKYVAIGGTQRAYNTLKKLVYREDVKLSYLIIMPGYEDEIPASKKILEYAKEKKIPHDYCDKISDNLIKIIKKINPKVILGIGIWRSIVPEEFLNIPKYGYLGLHATPLPRYRGAAGIAWQIINGEDKIRAHALRLNNEIDAGKLILKDQNSIFSYSIDIDNDLHLNDILIEYERIHIKFCNEILTRVLNNDLEFIDQDEDEASYTCFRVAEDGHINWDDTAKNIFNFIRAQSKPYPGAFSYYRNAKVIIDRCRINDKLKNYIGRIPGKIVERNKKTGIVSILTKDAGIDILEIRTSFKAPYEIIKSVKGKLE